MKKYLKKSIAIIGPICTVILALQAIIYIYTYFSPSAPELKITIKYSKYEPPPQDEQSFSEREKYLNVRKRKIYKKGIYYVTVKNNGKETARDIKLKLPNITIARISPEDSPPIIMNITNNIIPWSKLAPDEKLEITAWSDYIFVDLEKIKCTLEKGKVKIITFRHTHPFFWKLSQTGLQVFLFWLIIIILSIYLVTKIFLFFRKIP